MGAEKGGGRGQRVQEKEKGRVVASAAKEKGKRGNQCIKLRREGGQ